MAKIEHNLIGVTDVEHTQDGNTFTGTETLQKHVYFVNDTSIAMAKKNFIMRFLKRIPLEDLERLVAFKSEDVELEGQYTEGAKFTAELKVSDVSAKAEEFAQKLKAMRAERNPDTEINHIKADAMLCEVLNDLGYSELVTAFEVLNKWHG